ncbi:MAG: hypothetical protein WB683_08090 [Candidatus Sulfotelmatobacter sp.]
MWESFGDEKVKSLGAKVAGIPPLARNAKDWHPAWLVGPKVATCRDVQLPPKGIPIRGGRAMEEREPARVSREIRLDGYIFDEATLRDIDEIAAKCVTPSGANEAIASRYSITNDDRELLPFDSIELLIDHLNRAPDKVRRLALRHTFQRQAGIDVVFSKEAEIRISGFSGGPDFQFNVEQINEAILSLREDYSWAVKVLVFPTGSAKVGQRNFFLAFSVPSRVSWLLRICNKSRGQHRSTSDSQRE